MVTENTSFICALVWHEKRIQISPWGNVWPCCHIADTVEGINNYNKTQEISADMDMNPDWNNLNNYTLAEILDNTWFTDKLDNAVEHGTYQVCKQSCNV